MESGFGVWRRTLLAIVFLCIPGGAFASHHVFSSSVDRFEVDGNAFGPHDGTLDFVDEFDDGTIAPDWTPLYGTNVESGGVVTLKNPGFDIVIGTASLDVSNIENETEVEDHSVGDPAPLELAVQHAQALDGTRHGAVGPLPPSSRGIEFLRPIV